MHEVYGPAANMFATLAGQKSSLVLWIQEKWKRETLNPLGIKPFLDPERFLMARTHDQISGLSVAEEALRDGAIPFVVIEVTRALNFREGRRLQLAAQTGRTTGLCIISEGMGSNATETRWNTTPVFDPETQDSTLMRWELKRNKKGTLDTWHVRWDQETCRVHVVSPAGNGSGVAHATGRRAFCSHEQIRQQ